MGKPIIAYSIEAAMETGLFERIVVSTDSREIAEVAAKHGAEICIRPDALAVNEVGTFDVVRHALRCYLNDDYDQVCCVYATNPMISPEDIVSSSDLRLYGRRYDHVVSIGYPDLRDASHFYWSTAQAIEDNLPYFDNKSTTMCYKIDPRRICDINTHEDWAEAIHKYKMLHTVTTWRRI